ncbi:hypothetical protein ABZ519_37370 [Streptomyces collinus]
MRSAPDKRSVLVEPTPECGAAPPGSAPGAPIEVCRRLDNP